MEFEELKGEFIETFESVKEAVRKTEGKSRGGLMLGLQDLGSSPNGFVGAYYPVDSNIIVINKSPLRRLLETEPGLLKPYLFHVLLHEYVHSLGVLDENATRWKTYEISRRIFGENHIATELSKNMENYMTNLVYPVYGWKPDATGRIELVKGFDRSSTNGYIA
jgi:hypothetical protein